MFKNLFKKTNTPFKHHVEICISNSAYGDPDVFDLLLEQDNIVVEEVGCNSYCEICACNPYALINNEKIIAQTEAELYEKIMNYIHEFH